MAVTRGLLLTFFSSIAAFGQSPSARPEFEVASVKKSAPAAAGQVNIGVHIDGAMVRYGSLPMKSYIRMAYRVNDYQVLGPDWLAAENFDIAAKLPDGATRAQLPEMIQSLLAERFKLVLHRDKKEFPVYALTVAKNGPKLKESPPDPAAEASPGAKATVDVNITAGRGGGVIDMGNGSSIGYSRDHLEAKKVTMTALAGAVERLLDRPVVEMTGIGGTYDFSLEYSWDEVRSLVRSTSGGATELPANAADPGTSIFTSLAAFGLRLESRKAPVEVLVIDRIERTPTEN
ncbi:MAG: TIGR03435 family protein [Bryobacteraceae bacterium]|jgi:uncharacterized protein (TIGR03435 family)